MFNHLITLERRVEAALQRKRAAATAALAMPQVVQRKIRLYLFSTHSGQQSSADTAGGVQHAVLQRTQPLAVCEAASPRTSGPLQVVCH